MAKKKARAKARKPAKHRPRKIARQESLPGMDDNKITAIENAALDYAELRDSRQQLTVQEVDCKKKLIELMHKERKTEYKRGNILVRLVNEKENVKVKVSSQDSGDDEPEDVELGEGAAT